MRKTLNYILLVVIVVTLLFALTSCGAPSAKSESDIRADIQREDSYFSNYNLKIDSSTITKRQTNSDSKTDYVWISIVGQTEEFTYFADYELTYVLYNDGWLLEDFNKTDSDYEAKTKPNIVAIESMLPATYKDCTLVSENQSSANAYRYLYSGYSEISSVLFAQYDLTVTAYFSPNNGWTMSLAEKEGSLYWDLNGTWEYNDGNLKISAIVNDFVEDPNGRDHILTLEYTCITNNGTVSSDGTIEYHLQNDFHHNSLPYYLENLYVDWSNGPKVYINIAGAPVVTYGNTTGEGLFFEIWDGKDWYYQILTRTT